MGLIGTESCPYLAAMSWALNSTDTRLVVCKGGSADPDWRKKAQIRKRQEWVTLQLHGVPHLQPRMQLFAQLSVQPCEATKAKLDLLRHSNQQSFHNLI